MIKTNATRLLTAAKIEFEIFEYTVDESDLSGIHIANQLGEDPECVFKTLVCRGERQGINVFCIPVGDELDLKKCAVAIKDKKIEMIAVKELLALTGYVRGGCSPVGMKKKYPTYIHLSAKNHDKIYVSAGKRGGQIYINPDDLAEYTGAEFVDIISEK